MTLDELSRLCDGATEHYCEFTTVNNSEFYEAARRYMPLLIEVARAVQKSSIYYGDAPEVCDALAALESAK